MRPSETVRAAPSVGLSVLQGSPGTLAERSTGRCCHWLTNLTRQGARRFANAFFSCLLVVSL
jgi:hypothetical protein